jgi:RimJ/RimL family protein N-acetyltransferase
VKFDQIRTERLLVRAFEPADVVGLFERRNDPDIAKYQDWSVPFPIERAQSMVDSMVAMEGPENDDWWMAVVCLADSDEVVGDLAVHLSWDCRSAEVGYNFLPSVWGQGYAVESLGALTDYLFANDVTRVFGMLHPDNTASAMVLERVGMLFEGHTKLSFWDDEGPSDDWIYGMTKPDRDRWLGRNTAPPMEVTLEEITADNLDAVYALRTHHSQEAFVAPVPRSIAQGTYPGEHEGHPIHPWLRAVYADGEPAGFVMVAERTEFQPVAFLWRLLIDREHQRRGIGKQVLDLVIDHAKRTGAPRLDVSWHQGKGSPERFYLDYGFVQTGMKLGDEVEASLDLSHP